MGRKIDEAVPREFHMVATSFLYCTRRQIDLVLWAASLRGVDVRSFLACLLASAPKSTTKLLLPLLNIVPSATSECHQKLDNA